MSDVDPIKASAAIAAAALVEPGMVVGLGSGTTSHLMLLALGERIRNEKLVFRGIATSEATAITAREQGIPLCNLDDFDAIDLNLDGADEIDPGFRMIKGRGGAMLREKLVVSAAKKRVTMVGPEKLVEQLGRGMPIPLEISPFGWKHVDASVRFLGAKTSLRLNRQGTPFITDGGHYILDCTFEQTGDPEELETQLKGIVGVFETGLFVGLCDLLIVGHGDHVETMEKPPIFLA